MGIEPLGFTEVLEIFVICNDCERVVSSLQPMRPLLQGQLDGQQLPVADVVVLLCWGQFLRVICARLEVWRLTKHLGQHSPDSRGGGVHFYYEWYLGIRMFKDGGCAESSLELLGFMGAGVPGQGLGLTTEQGGQC